MANLSGQYLGRYHLLERLGEGGMATVYKAYDTRLEREVAVKIIRNDAFSPDTLDEILKRFEREAKSLARLSHPNIVKIHDYGEYEGSPFLVLEYLSGGTLKKMLGEPIPWKDVIRLLLPIAHGLAYAHQHGILHRDIKPANILITEGGEPMLSDFGIAKMFEGEQTTNLTTSGMFVGTPEYTAPEQWTGTTSPQADMYSLGLVLYEMMTGRKPYVADTPVAIFLKQVSEPLPRPSELVSNLPESVERFLLKVLAKDPADRYEDMNAMVKAMEGTLSIPDVPASPKPIAISAPVVTENPLPATRRVQSPPKSRPKYSRGCLPIATIAICGIGAMVVGIVVLLVWNTMSGNVKLTTVPTPTKPATSMPSTATLTPVPMLIPTDTPLPLTETPTPTPASPNAPANFEVRASCKKVVVKHTEELGGYTFYWLETTYDFVADLSWEDKSDNETGFEIFKNGNPLKTLDANTTKFRDTSTFPQATNGNIIYTIQAINDVEKSKAVEITVQYICK